MNPNRLEPVLVLLAVMILFFTGLLVAMAKFFPTDGQTFQVISGLLTGFGGAFLARIKPAGNKDDPAGDAVTKQP